MDLLTFVPPTNSDILHPGRANISKEELREKLSGMYKASKDQVSVFGLRTQFGGGKTTGFALVYDSPEAMKKFEPRYRLVRVGMATKVEKASRQQREWTPLVSGLHRIILVDGLAFGDRTSQEAMMGRWQLTQKHPLTQPPHNRQATQEQAEDSARHSKGQGPQGEEGEIDDGRSIDLFFSYGFGSLALANMGFIFVVCKILISTDGRHSTGG